MGQFSHPNIISLLGVVTLGEPVSVTAYNTTHASTNIFLVSLPSVIECESSIIAHVCLHHIFLYR